VRKVLRKATVLVVGATLVAVTAATAACSESADEPNPSVSFEVTEWSGKPENFVPPPAPLSPEKAVAARKVAEEAGYIAGDVPVQLGTKETSPSWSVVAYIFGDPERVALVTVSGFKDKPTAAGCVTKLLLLVRQHQDLMLASHHPDRAKGVCN
jgi:hypothetical protein